MLEVKAGTDFVARVFLVDATDHTTPISGLGAKKAKLDMDVDVGTGFDSIFQLRVPGNTSFEMSLATGISLTLISETSGQLTVQYNNGVTTVAELCDFIDANSQFVEVLFRGTSEGHVLTNPGDTFSSEPFSGGDDDGVGTDKLACWTSVGSRDWYRRDGNTITGLTDGDATIIIGEPQEVDLTPVITRDGSGDYHVYVPGTLTSGHVGKIFSIYLLAYDDDGVPISDVGLVRCSLVAYNPTDPVRLGLTALPNAAAEAAGGLYTRGSGAGQIAQQTNGQIDTNIERVRNAVIATLTASGFLKATVLRWLTDDAAGTPAALTATGKFLQALVARWATDDAQGTVPTPTFAGLPSVEESTLRTRLSSARAGYLDNLNVSGLVASSAEVTAIQNNTRVVIVVPEAIERPDAGTVTYRIELFVYDEVGNMEALFGAPTITLVNQTGTDRSSRLDSTLMTLVSTGYYRAIYTAAAADALEQLVWTFSVIENAQTRLYGRGSIIVDTTAVDFTAADRTKLNRLDTDYTTARAGKIDNLDATITSVVTSIFNRVIETITIAPHNVVPYDVTFERAVRGLVRHALGKLVGRKGAAPAVRDLNNTKDSITAAIGADRTPTIEDLD